MFNLVVNLFFEVPRQLVVSGFIHWLWIMAVVTLVDSYMDTGCGSCNTCKVICHPCHDPAFHVQDKSQ